MIERVNLVINREKWLTLFFIANKEVNILPTSFLEGYFLLKDIDYI